MKSFLSEIVKFTEYCQSFYSNETGLYPTASSEGVKEAVDGYLYQMWTEQRFGSVQFDSFDREQVKSFIIRKNIK